MSRKSTEYRAFIFFVVMLVAIILTSLFSVAQHYVLSASTLVALNERGPGEGFWWPEIASRDTYANWLMAIVASVGLVVSLIGVFLVRATFIETKRTAEAAIESNNTARRLGEAQVRAYVSWSNAMRGIARLTETGEIAAFVLTPTITNTGQSPAELTLLYADIVYIEPGTPLPSPPTFERAPAEVEHSLGAGNFFNMAECHIPTENVNEVASGQMRCFLVGYGEYRDVFWLKEEDTHVFSFCFEVIFPLPMSHPSQDEFISNVRLQNIPRFTIRPIR